MMKTYLVHGTRWLGLVLALIFAQTISGMISSGLLADSMPATFFNAGVDWLGIFTTAALEAAAVYCLLTGLQAGRKHQLWILFAFYWGTKFFQMWIEAVFFLNVWQTPPLMSWPELAFMLLYGTITAALFAPPAVWIASVKPTAPQRPIIFPQLMPALKIGTIYVPIYFVAGMAL